MVTRFSFRLKLLRVTLGAANACTTGSRVRDYVNLLTATSVILTLDMSRTSAARSIPALEAAQAAGFVVGGEPLAVDLADTLVMVTNPPTDLLVDEHACRRFWELQAPRLTEGWSTPTLEATRRLRDAIRVLLDAARESQAVDESVLKVVNGASERARTAIGGKLEGSRFVRVETWSSKTGADLALAAAARSAIEILTGSDAAGLLRRCANPECSMLFVYGDSRRQWCTPNICGNRARVARHYHRHRVAKTEP